jgi:hypothetical protein
VHLISCSVFPLLLSFQVVRALENVADMPGAERTCILFYIPSLNGIEQSAFRRGDCLVGTISHADHLNGWRYKLQLSTQELEEQVGVARLNDSQFYRGFIQCGVAVLPRLLAT